MQLLARRSRLKPTPTILLCLWFGCRGPCEAPLRKIRPKKGENLAVAVEVVSCRIIHAVGSETITRALITIIL